MNLFQKYGIKEVADVVFYSITPVGDEEFYTPVLYLDTLKVSTLEKSAEKVEARGGKGNKKLITWNFGKEVTLNLEDALFSPASMSMIWGGKLNAKLSDYTSTIVKCNIANKYGEQNFSTKAYPSPALTDNEWDIIFDCMTKYRLSGIVGEQNLTLYVNDTDIALTRSEPAVEGQITWPHDDGDLIWYKYNMASGIKIKNPNYGTGATFNIFYIAKYKNNDTIGVYKKNSIFTFSNSFEENKAYLGVDHNELSAAAMRHLINMNNSGITDASGLSAEDKVKIMKQYFQRTGEDQKEKAISGAIIKNILSKITNLKDIGYIDTDIYDIEVIDRMEKCIVKKRDGQKISIKEQKKNLFRYYADDKSSSYTIFYDAKTMLPLLPIKDGIIQNWDTDNNTIDDTADDNDENDIFTIKTGTIYYKWTRTVKHKESEEDGVLGKTFVIDAETFPDTYRIVGETYIRNQKTGKDQRYQFTIFNANVSSDTSITLEAEGDPTTFSMQIDVLTPPNDIMMELKQYDVEDDVLEGGTRIVPQKSKYTYTATNIELIQSIDDKNEEIY